MQAGHQYGPACHERRSKGKDPTERFSSRVANYARYRPSSLRLRSICCRVRCGLGAATVAADVRSGTGILARLLLARGARVFGVKPNRAGMRAAAEALLAGDTRFRSVKGSAEATTLDPESVDLFLAAQAFHWFKADRARHEALRVARPGAFGALLWNERPPAASAFLTEYEALVRRHAEYDQVVGSRADEASMRAFFGGPMGLPPSPMNRCLTMRGSRAG